MSSNQLPTIVIGSAVLGAALLLAAWPGEPAPIEPTPRAALRPVRVAEVGLAPTTRDLRLPGVTRATARANLGFVVPARLAARGVELGDAVAAGAVLARLDDREFRLAERTAAAAVTELEVRLAQARRDRARVAELVAAKAATSEELEQVGAATEALEAAYEAAVARRDESRRLLSETVLTAPFAGSVTAVHLEPGEWAAPGAPVLELAGRGAVEVRIELPEAARGALTAGIPATVELPLLGVRLAGRVVSVAAAAPAGGGLFPAVIALEPSPVAVAGLAAEVIVTLDRGHGLTVPLAAVLDSGSSRPAIFRIVGGRAERLEIEPHEVIGDRITVDSPRLAAGDLVAVVGQTALVDGDAVEVF